MDRGENISYTQWEAWLALYHNKALLIAQPDNVAPRGPKFAPTAESRKAQQAHLNRLRFCERYPGCTFTSPDQLAKQIAYTTILDLLAKEHGRAGHQRQPPMRESASANIEGSGNIVVGAVGSGINITVNAASSDQIRPISLFEPRVPAHYRNREHEIEQVFNAFAEHRWCGLYGMGGVGKTSTAARIAQQVRTKDHKSVIWLSVGEGDVAVSLECLANAVGYSLRSIRDQWQKEAHLRAITAEQGVLIVFDDVHTSEQLHALLSCVGAGNHVITTARQEEAPIAIKFGILPIMIAPLSPADSALVLMHLIGIGDTKRENVDDWKTLASGIGNLPLALEIIAGDFRGRSLHDPLKYADERIATGKWAAGEPTIDRLRKSLIDSIGKLDPRFISAFSALGVFEGTAIDHDAMRAVCDFDSTDELETFVRALQQRMFIRLRDDGRLAMHPFVTETARIALAERRQPESKHRGTPLGRHIDYYHRMLVKNGGYEWNLRNYQALVPHELEIIRAIDSAASHWRERRGGIFAEYRDLCVKMTWLVSWYLNWRGHWDLRVRLCKRITDRAEEGDMPGYAGVEGQIGNLYVDRGWIHLFRGDLDAAAICAEAGARWLKHSVDDIFAAELWGQIAFARTDYAEAHDLFETLRGKVRVNTRAWFVFSYRLFDTLLAMGHNKSADELLSSLAEAVQHPILVHNEIIEDIHARILYRLALRHLASKEDTVALELLRQTVRKFDESGIMTQDRAAAGIDLACLLGKLKLYEESHSELSRSLRHARAFGDFALVARGQELRETLPAASG